MTTYTTDLFLGGQFKLKQSTDGYRATSDSVLLAAAVPVKAAVKGKKEVKNNRPKAAETVLDIGAGSGVIGLCLKKRVPEIEVAALEIQPELCQLIKDNALLNNENIEVIQGDISEKPSKLHGRQFHYVVTNPPFYTEDIRRKNAQAACACCPNVGINAWILLSLKYLRPKGVFCMIHRTQDLPEILSALNGRIGAIEVFPIVPKEGTVGKRIVIRGILGSKKPFVLRPPLAMHTADGKRTQLAEDIMRAGIPY